MLNQAAEDATAVSRNVTGSISFFAMLLNTNWESCLTRTGSLACIVNHQNVN